MVRRLSMLYLCVGVWIVHGVAWSGEKRSACESFLIAPIIKQLMVAKLTPVAKALSEIGLPKSNWNSEVMLGPSRESVTLDSDLGRSIWLIEELDQWLDLLNPAEQSPQAVKLIESIGAVPGKCPSGILPALCQHLRSSRQIRIEAMSSRFYRSLMTMDFGDPRAKMGFERLIQKLHHERNILRFAWGEDPNHFPLDLAPHQAKDIAQLLIRESLIRHLQFKSLEGIERSGKDLSLETRLMIAEAPGLAPLLAFFERYPLDIPIDHIFGKHGKGTAITIIDAPLPIRFDHLRAYLIVKFRRSLPAITALTASVVIDSEQSSKPVSEGDRATLSEALNSFFTTAIGRFQAETGFNRKIVVAANPNAGGTFDLTLTGLSSIHQILFLYYVINSSTP